MNFLKTLFYSKNKIIFTIRIISFILFTSLTIYTFVEIIKDGYLVNHDLLFFFIVGCFVNSLIFNKYSFITILASIGMAFNLLGDSSLTLSSGIPESIGILFFFVVQTAYLLRIYLLSNSKKQRSWIIRSRILVNILILIIFLVIPTKFEFMVYLTVFYYGNFLHNVVTCCIVRTSYLFLIGLILFSLCDLIVGLDQSIYYVDLGDKVTSLISNNTIYFSWLFYTPGQYLLSLSAGIDKPKISSHQI